MRFGVLFLVEWWARSRFRQCLYRQEDGLAVLKNSGTPIIRGVMEH